MPASSQSAKKTADKRMPLKPPRQPKRVVTVEVELPSLRYQAGRYSEDMTTGGTFKLTMQNGNVKVTAPCGEKLAMFDPGVLQSAVELVRAPVQLEA